MHISYKPLWHTLLERDMRKEDLRLAAGMTTNMIANMSKEGKHISMDTLARICETLNCEIIINNTPTVDELEAKVKAGEQISLVDLANAVKADKERGKGAKPEKKPSIRAQLRADKEKAQKKNAKQKSQDLERS